MKKAWKFITLMKSFTQFPKSEGFSAHPRALFSFFGLEKWKSVLNVIQPLRMKR